MLAASLLKRSELSADEEQRDLTHSPYINHSGLIQPTVLSVKPLFNDTEMHSYSIRDHLALSLILLKIESIMGVKY